ncbi:MAG: hypothetical protein GY927_20815 [bacterium]|nr:hypothetical protein [bacterium]
MTRRVRRNHTPASKSKVPLKVIKGEKTLSELAQQFDVHYNQIKQKPEPTIDVKTLHAKIGELILENDFLETALTKAGLPSAKK